MNQEQINQAEWDNPDNWKSLVYCSSRDNRVFVPKRYGVGVTMNFGHKSSKWTMVVILVVALLPGVILLLGLLGRK